MLVLERKSRNRSVLQMGLGKVVYWPPRRGNRSTVDMIFCLRQLQEKCIEQDRPLYMVFVDFGKAFDTVGRTGL